MPPTLTVIIPTAGRISFLLKAIKSALGIVDDCEVLIVPNGSSQAWLSIVSIFEKDPRVKWLPIEQANVSAARNYGLENAQGEFIRFLDDDDYLFPEACAYQLNEIIVGEHDVVSGAVQLITVGGRLLKKYQMLESEDFCYAALHPNRCVQVGAHLYRRAAVANIRWNVERSLNEDMQWLLDVACLTHLKWKRVDKTVAAWVQHDNERLSRGSDPGNDTLKYSASILCDAEKKLQKMNAFSQNRQEAFADGLWSLLQKGLRYDYPYWREIAKIADSHSPGRRPPSKIHRVWPFKKIHPLIIETTLIPARWLYNLIRPYK